MLGLFHAGAIFLNTAHAHVARTKARLQFIVFFEKLYIIKKFRLIPPPLNTYEPLIVSV